MWGSRKYPYPTREGISLRTSPPPWIFHIYKELVTPSTPLEFPLSKTKPPQPLWKSLFSRKKYYQSKERCRLQLCNGFHFILLNKNTVNYLQSNLNYKILLIPWNEREKVASVSYVCLPWCASLRFFFPNVAVSMTVMLMELTPFQCEYDCKHVKLSTTI